MGLLKDIVQQLPYQHPFLFVDELVHVDEHGCTGFYTFPKTSWFYEGHFKDHPVTPGVILTECMAQIGLVCLGIYLNQSARSTAVAFSESHVVFEKPVYPGEKLKVVSRKIYWRLKKLKCSVEMYNAQEIRVCHGELSGIIAKENE